MTNRERILAVLNHQTYDKLPVIHFGFWNETIEKWVKEGYLTEEEGKTLGWNGVAKKLGFDSNFNSWVGCKVDLFPAFEEKVVKFFPDGTEHFLQDDGVIVLRKPDAGSIPAEIEHTLIDRESWEEHYKPRLQFSEDRIDKEKILKLTAEKENQDALLGLYCGSILGKIRNWVGLEDLSYLLVDDEELVDEMIETVGELSYQVTKAALEAGLRPDVAQFWEDIAFNNGPLVSPVLFAEKCGKQYKKTADLLASYGCDLLYVDCDGIPDLLIPTWLENGVKVMCPIEVGTWGGSFAPWHEKYGDEIRAIGGMKKAVFAMDFEAIDEEIERLRPIIELGGFIPMPDHRIPPDAIWENVEYYCKRMKEEFQ